MLAAKTAEPFIDTFSIANLPAEISIVKNNIQRTFAAHALQRARHLYVAKSLATPNQAIPNNRLSLIRKLGWLLIIFQILDGLFTILGISFFGVEIEGNPLVRQIIEVIGPNFGIGLVKLSTIAIIFCICVFGCKVTWLTRALAGVSCIYFLFALAPWSLVLGSLVFES